MNETPGQGPASAFDPAAGAEAPSAGTLLRQARELAGLHVATLAAALKVPVRKLEALEADRFDLLPDAVFVRALAASVCRNLKLDPAAVLERLPATGAPRLAPSQGGINAPFRSPRDGAGPGWRDQLTRPVFLVVAALLVGALVVALLPLRHDDVASEKLVFPPPEAATPAPEPVAAGPAAATAAPAAVPAPRTSASPTPATPVASVAVAPAPATAPGASAPPGAANPAAAGMAATAARPGVVAASSATAASAASGIVVFKAKAQSWVQVTDARGGVALRKLLAAGESAAASGPLPLAVTVGSVSATEVQVRGKAFDLAPVSRDNVARFEVK